MILQDKDEKEAFDFVCKLADRATDRICNDLNPDDYEKFKHLLVDREEVNGTKIKDNVAFDFDILYWLKNRAVFLGKQVVPHDKDEKIKVPKKVKFKHKDGRIITLEARGYEKAKSGLKKLKKVRSSL